MIIQHNMLAMNNLYMGKRLQKDKAKTMERLASGYRINRAADDAANMAISEKMTSRIRALARCQQNIEEGISLTQTADGALNEVNAMLNRVNELCARRPTAPTPPKTVPRLPRKSPGFMTIWTASSKIPNLIP